MPIEQKYFSLFSNLFKRLTTNNNNNNYLKMAPPNFETFKVKKLSDKAIIPQRGSKGAAGYDLSSAHELVVPAHGKALAMTDLQIAIPDGTYGRIAPRSGLAWKNFIDCGAGVIDSDYRGNVGVVLFNHSDVDFKVAVGDRVAQLIFERIVTPEPLEVDEIDETQRGAGGFGSTGVKVQN
ncbi:dUTP diphosphatase [Dictyostelium discoideum AX4]|uniref:Deoxyuridine 5'-triphosphate nucleotidohydrolase, mitochondrial n=1 Tax=Dictyostelium discoideum TaxID=44689 RepID=DUT_DICDI|nr:dUTP diphosphatase [Dictyostelium discoideum AX4]Q54BW5.1 RecName: Full=Deoxyuridine 5'-triphosphate nucleotidohydrolase, mitochondrial; Short=dUTPase; AltName: Full=dUTP pyrophosphatase; Flags: Precursor [Dictyostelium discoideum]EAL60754.1 dUTP diphosphatase [Dictyostelium discoideum AX4]|eukprot:XP_629169.1 dUTP diphosphatase [Dictyostelium discoideum AX4]